MPQKPEISAALMGLVGPNADLTVTRAGRGSG